MKKNEAKATETGDAPAPEQLDGLQASAAKSDEYKDNWIRAAADLENFKKRAARERTEAAQFANASLLQKLIPILDNFEMAQTAAQTAQDDKLASLQSGIAMIQQQLKSALTEAGLEEIDATENCLTRRGTKPFHSRRPPPFQKAMSPSSFARVTSCANACCVPPPSS